MPPATIDWSAPIALDNGREARLIGALGGGAASVQIKGAYAPRAENRYHPNEWYEWSYDKDGTWSSADPTHYKIVNIDDSASFIPEDWS